MSEQNRNLSDVIHTITDEGPSSQEAQESAAVDTPEAPATHEVQPRRTYLWPLVAGLLAGLLIASLFLRTDEGGSSSPDALAIPAKQAQATIQPRLLEMQQRQDMLDQQLKQLASVVAESNAILLKLLESRAASDARQQAVLGGLAATQKSVEETPAATAVTVPADAVATAVVQESPQPDAAATDERPVPADVVMAQLPPVHLVADSDALAQGWVINVAFFDRQEPVQALMQRFTEAGITTEQLPLTVNGVNGYRLRITGFSTQEEAADFMKNGIDKSLGIEGPWISRYE